ncbi:PGF-CTERM sorting domain-containing protein [Halococcus hamelinensis]|uniref:PGF-CTERM sorting domain-containing protein n=2 Tax=Halococcus hamelinensis TaxID=332168 RepID=UPI001EF9EB6F|nr:PGF-CTERM sorting domain-containing protein [Halococcus hamelinensis]
MSLAVLVVLSAAVGAVALTGPAAAQESGENATNATDGSFYSPSEDDPLNVRFRNCCGTTVDSVADGVLNLNVVYGLFDGAYDLDISASGLSDDELDEVVFTDEGSDATDLDRTDIVGMDFSGVPAGEYEFTVSVTDGEGEATVPIEVTGDEGATNETNASAANETADESANESVSNETTSNASAANATDETSGNASIVANPATPGNESAFHNVSVVAGPEAEGNLSSVTVNYGESNASIGLVGGNIASATLDGDQVVNNTTTSSIGVDGRNLTVGFDGTLDVEEGDRITLNYTGVTNPTEAGEYTTGVGVNNGSVQNTTLAVSEPGSANATAGEDNASNASAANATDASGNASIVASPSAAGNESAFHNVSVVAGPDAEGNLSAVTVNYGESNASIGLVGGNIASATLDGDQVVNNTTTSNIGVDGRNLTVGFDGTLDVEEGDRITLNYTGVTNPPESGDYTVGVVVNNGSVQNTTLAVTESSAGANGTTGAGTTSATTDAGTAETTAMGTTSGGAATSGDAGTGGAGTSGDEEQGTEAGGPGFGVVVAVVALLAAALVAVRRR